MRKWFWEELREGARWLQWDFRKQLVTSVLALGILQGMGCWGEFEGADGLDGREATKPRDTGTGAPHTTGCA